MMDQKEYCCCLEKGLLALIAIGIQREHKLKLTNFVFEKDFSDNSLTDNIELVK